MIVIEISFNENGSNKYSFIFFVKGDVLDTEFKIAQKKPIKK